MCGCIALLLFLQQPPLLQPPTPAAHPYRLPTCMLVMANDVCSTLNCCWYSWSRWLSYSRFCRSTCGVAVGGAHKAARDQTATAAVCMTPHSLQGYASTPAAPQTESLHTCSDRNGSHHQGAPLSRLLRRPPRRLDLLLVLRQLLIQLADLLVQAAQQLGREKSPVVKSRQQAQQHASGKLDVDALLPAAPHRRQHPHPTCHRACSACPPPGPSWAAAPWASWCRRCAAWLLATVCQAWQQTGSSGGVKARRRRQGWRRRWESLALRLAT